MPGLGSDTRDRDAGTVGRGGVSSAERVAGDPFGVGQAGSFRACFEQPTEGVGCEPAFTGRAAAERNEHRPRCGAAESEPMLEGGDRIGVWMLAARDGDLGGAGGVAVGLGAADPQNYAVRTRLEVVQGECGEFADAQRAGVPDQDEGGVAGPAECCPVDASGTAAPAQGRPDAQ